MTRKKAFLRWHSSRLHARPSSRFRRFHSHNTTAEAAILMLSRRHPTRTSISVWPLPKTAPLYPGPGATRQASEAPPTLART